MKSEKNKTSCEELSKFTIIILVFLFIPATAFASTPSVTTPAPVIYLADNLDESQNLGWCIDTVGRGYAEKLHAHSCKTRGGDVQFRIIAESGQIQSVAFPDKCMTLVDAESKNTPWGLRDCDPGSRNQKIAYVTESGQLQFSADPRLCVTVGVNSSSAGPFMSRDLLLEDCMATPTNRKQWVVKE